MCCFLTKRTCQMCLVLIAMPPNEFRTAELNEEEHPSPPLGYKQQRLMADPSSVPTCTADTMGRNPFRSPFRLT